MLPKLKETAKSRDMVQEFKGVNHNVRISDSEFYDMTNMSSDLYPALSPRKPRGVAMKLTDCGGLLAKDKLCYIENDVLHYGDKQVQLVRNIGRERQLISFGAYVIVFPDQIYLNTADVSDTGKIIDHEEYTYPQKNNTVAFELVDKSGNSIPIMYINGCTWAGASVEINFSQFSPSGNYAKNTLDYLSSSEWDANAVKVEPYNTFGSAILEYINIQKAAYGDKYLFFSVNSSARKPSSQRFIIGYNYKNSKFQQSNENVVIDNFIDETNTSVFYVEPLKDTSKINELTWTYYNSSQAKFYIEVKSYKAPQKDEYLLDCTVSPAKVKKWTGTRWTTIETYVKITTTGIGTALDGKDDGMRLVGFASLENVYKNTGMFDDLIKQYSFFGKVESYTADSITVPGVLTTGFTKISNVSGVELTVKDLNPIYDYVVESQNRLWACRYGEDETGEKINKIYASALGDFKTWDKFDGTDADSYFANLGTDGAFTGAINYKGYPIFFKENCIHRVYGNLPSQYQVTTDNSFGLQSGSAKSLQVLSGRLFFKAIDGIYAYDGANVTPISLKLGTGRFFDAVGGNVDSKYYVSMVSEEDGKRRLFVYDVLKDMWHVEDNIDVSCMERYNDNLYIADKSGTVYTVKDKSGTSKEKVEWSVESGIIGYSLPDSKYVSCMQIRAAIEHDAEMSIYIQYDSDGFWEYKGTMTGNNLMSHTIPIQPKRCDHFKLKIEGKGECRVFSITKILENGGIV